MPASIQPGDLGRVDLNEVDDNEVAVGWEVPERRRRGRAAKPSKWVTYIALAESLARVHGGTQPDEIEGQKVQVGPWVHYPKNSEPIVGAQIRRDLEKVFGPGSEYQETNGGAYFEVILRDTVSRQSPGKKSRNTYGVLYVRKVIPGESDA